MEPIFSQVCPPPEDPNSKERMSANRATGQVVSFQPSVDYSPPRPLNRSSDCQFSNKSPNYSAKQPPFHGNRFRAKQRSSNLVKRSTGNAPPDFDGARHFNNVNYCQFQNDDLPAPPVLNLGQTRPSDLTRTEEAVKIYRKRVAKDICKMDDDHHVQDEIYTCDLCRLIMPDEVAMKAHIYGINHSKLLLESSMVNAELTPVHYDSDSSESSGGIPPKTRRVSWNVLGFHQ